ncbi:MAG: alpha/beta hydrolase [Flavobacteriaceae bacterium]|nr:alpha/beta hydrolase [Flavobacteriaceae bacterium]
MKTIHLYLMPGMAANPKIFEKLSFPTNFETHYLEWIDPIKNESVADYAKRMCSFIQHENSILIGVSFGGIIVQEMKNHLNNPKTIIISSIKTKHEHSLLSKFVKKTKIFYLIPYLVIHALEFMLKIVFGKKAAERIDLYNMYLSKRDFNYLNWALKSVLYWNRETADPEIIHIHGNKDEIFPIKYLKNCIIVERGTHIMIINKAKIISELIQQQNIE